MFSVDLHVQLDRMAVIGQTDANSVVDRDLLLKYLLVFVLYRVFDEIGNVVHKRIAHALETLTNKNSWKTVFVNSIYVNSLFIRSSNELNRNVFDGLPQEDIEME